MRIFTGCIIEESLADPAVLAGMTPVAERVSDMPKDPNAKTCHVRWYRLNEADFRARLPDLTDKIRRNWYAHFWSEDDLCVILHGRHFWAKISDRSTYQKFIRYADQVGLERKYSESVPTTLPSWVQKAISC